MEVDDVYQYSTLKGEDSIRLIFLQPCEDLKATIECSLKDTTLTEYREDIGDHYIAISYVWGDKNDTRLILVDGKRLNITASLDSALRHVRDIRRVLCVLADGVCINQKDIHDRNRQVGLMGDVYSTAQHTVIFLGPSSPECDAVLRLISSEPQRFGQSEQSSGVPTQEFSRLLDGYEAIVGDKILARPWFTRVWILQELVLSQNAWLQCGKTRVKWNKFCGTVLASVSTSWKFQSRAILKDMNESRIKFETARVGDLEKPEKFPGSSLLELLRSRRGCALSDPRDMVYAHLGLASFTTRKSVPIDYDKTVVQVYEDIAYLYIEWAGLDTVLSLVDNVQPENRPGYLPSWVTDWSIRSPNTGTYISDPGANRTTKSPLDLSVSRVVHGVLALVGDYYGIIDWIVPISSWPALEIGADHPTIASILQWIARSDDQFLRSKRLLVNLSVKLALSRNPPVKLSKSEDTAWADVTSIMSRWWEPLGTFHYCMDGSMEERKREIKLQQFVEACIENLMAVPRHYEYYGRMAVLDGGAVIRLPELARPGDIMIAPSTHYLQGSFSQLSHSRFYLIIRRCEVKLSPPEQTLIKKDLEKHPSQMHWADRTLQSYKFVTITGEPVLHHLHVIEDFLKKYRDPIIFALH